MDIEECAAYFRSVMKTALHKFLHNCSNFNLCCVSTSVILVQCLDSVSVLVQCLDSVSILCSVLTAFRDLVHTTAKVQNLCPSLPSPRHLFWRQSDRRIQSWRHNSSAVYLQMHMKKA